MNGEHAKRRLQREFLFVFDSETQCGAHAVTSPICQRGGTPPPSPFDEEEAKSLRQRLISELKEFGC